MRKQPSAELGSGLLQLVQGGSAGCVWRRARIRANAGAGSGPERSERRPIEQLPAALWSILEDFPNHRLLLVVLRQAARLSLLERVAYRDRNGW